MMFPSMLTMVAAVLLLAASAHAVCDTEFTGLTTCKILNGAKTDSSIWLTVAQAYDGTGTGSFNTAFSMAGVGWKDTQACKNAYANYVCVFSVEICDASGAVTTTNTMPCMGLCTKYMTECTVVSSSDAEKVCELISAKKDATCYGDKGVAGMTGSSSTLTVSWALMAILSYAVVAIGM